MGSGKAARRVELRAVLRADGTGWRRVVGRGNVNQQGGSKSGCFVGRMGFREVISRAARRAKDGGWDLIEPPMGYGILYIAPLLRVVWYFLLTLQGRY